MLTLERPMGKQPKRGRPAKPADEGTRAVKLNADLVDMIKWIVKFRREQEPSFTAAQLVDPLLRPQILLQYGKVKDRVEKIKRDTAAAADNLAGGE